MSINEVFPNPTVKNVVFQIRFPNLFYIEDRIGELQLRIMKEFPESSLLYRQQVMFAQFGSDADIDKIANKARQDETNPIWQFRSPSGYQLNLLTDSLDINSQIHKSYANPQASVRFRDVIEFVLEHFFDIVRIPILTRVGLRYIDECPIFRKDNETYEEYFNTTFPLDRFTLQDADQLELKAVVKRGDFRLRFVESLRQRNEEPYLYLDFDGFATDVSSEDCLPVTDKLHELVIHEYERSIKQPLIDWMRKKREKTNGQGLN